MIDHEKRDVVKQRVREGLQKLIDNGTRPEHIAVNLQMSFTSVKNWMTGRRVPNRPTIRQIESIYRIRIL